MLERLRRRFTSEQAAAILTQARLQPRAARKFPHADHMILEQQALEQATAWPVALHRAERLHKVAPPGVFLDLGCGIGGDLMALAHFRPVIAWEIDPVRAAIAQSNAAALELPHPVVVRTGDWALRMADGSLTGECAVAAAFIDPGRRTEGKRVFSPKALEPPLSTILRLRNAVPVLTIKGPPGIDAASIPAGCAVEFVSHEGVCKEAVLWCGSFAGAEGEARREACVFDGRVWHEIAGSGQPAPLGAIGPGMVLYEPDPAVLRAGALTPLCQILGAHLFDPRIGYLVSDTLRATPLATAFAVRELFPFSLRQLNQRLRTLGVGQVELKKRGFPQEPESLRPRLQLTPGGPPVVVLLTRRGEGHWAILADRLHANRSDA